MKKTILTLITFIIIVGCSSKKVLVTSENRETVRTISKEIKIDSSPEKPNIPQAQLSPKWPKTNEAVNLKVTNDTIEFKSLKDLNNEDVTTTRNGVIRTKNWTKKLSSLLYAKPIVDNNKLYIQTTSNELYCFDLKNGKEIWSHKGMLSETPILPLSASSAIYDNFIITAFNSGEIVALDKNTGTLLWSDIALARVVLPGSTQQITASPIISDGHVYVLSQTSFLACYSLLTGERIWHKEISGTFTPLLCGNYLYVLTNTNKIIAINKKNAKVAWVSNIDLNNPLNPLIINSEIVVSNNEKIIFLNHSNGNIIKTIDLPKNDAVQMGVIKGQLIFFTP